MKRLILLLILLGCFGCVTAPSKNSSPQTILFSENPEMENWNSNFRIFKKFILGKDDAIPKLRFKGFSVWYTSTEKLSTELGFIRPKKFASKDYNQKFYGCRIKYTY